MQAVILAAGEGKRMQPLTFERPKPLIEVSGKSLIEHILEALPEAIDEVIIVTGYKGDMIRERLGNSYKGRKVTYVHQEVQSGTAHALNLVRPLLTGPFLLMNADDIHGKEALAEMVRHPLALLVAPHATPEKFGVVIVKDDGTLESIVEKPEKPIGNLVSTGAMVLDDRVFDYDVPQNKNGEYYITDAYGALAKDAPLKVIEQELWIPVGYPEDIEKAEEILKNREDPSA